MSSLRLSTAGSLIEAMTLAATHVEYDPETGALVRRDISEPVRISVKDGYERFCLAGHVIRVHQFAFFVMTGVVPKSADHINRNRSDNRWANLRPCTQSQNNANSPARSTSSTGIKGIYFDKARRRWRARIIKDGKQQEIGRFATPEAAGAAYERAAIKLFGEFAYRGGGRDGRETAPA